MTIIKKVIIKNQDTSNDIYPRTSADIVDYDNLRNLKQEIDYIDDQLVLSEQIIQNEIDNYNNNF